MEKKTVLLVDDDCDIHALVKHGLSNDFNILIAEDLARAEEQIANEKIVLMILDEVLPDGSGTDFLYKVKNIHKREFPVLMLTQKRELKDKLMAFNSGADDYIVKPFEPLELKARIKARLREHAVQEGGGVWEIGDLHFDLTTHGLNIRNGESSEKISLTPIEFKILYHLAINKDEVKSREWILRTVWGDDSHVVDRTVDQHVSKVRKKIGHSRFTLKSAHGKGYKFVERS